MSPQSMGAGAELHRRAALFTALIAAALAGCATGHPLMPTPELYTGSEARPLFPELPEDRRSPPLELLYLTDRAAATSPDAPAPYTADRARAMAFGVTTVEFGDDVAWETLVRESGVRKRSQSLDLELGPTRELGRFPPIPYRVSPTGKGISRAPAVLEAHEQASEALQAELSRRLAASPRKEMVLYVHGYHNDFEDAALTMGELCHFLGREFVCGIFTWPAGGSRGLLFGYEVDYESGEFAAEHLRKAIRTLSATPGLERLHILAHSRGTGVLATALSELGVEAYILEETLPERFKIGHVVLMAPDIDADVAPSRIFKILSDPDLPHGRKPEPGLVVRPVPDFKLTIYASPYDRALATSSLLFGSIARLGQIQESKLSPQVVAQIRQLGLLDVIQVQERTGLIGHSYFVSNPLVSSDIIAMLRYGLKPNEPGRPLVEIERPFWRVRTRKEALAQDEP